MNNGDHPNSKAAERRRKAAERARRQRAEAAAAAILNAAIVDGLSDAFARARPGMVARELILIIGEAALHHLGEAGVSKPKAAFKQRLGLTVNAEPGSCRTRPNQ